MRKTITVVGSETNAAIIRATLIVLRNKLGLNFSINSEGEDVREYVTVNADEAFGVVEAFKIASDLYFGKHDKFAKNFSKLAGKVITYIAVVDLQSLNLTEGEIVSGMMEYLK